MAYDARERHGRLRTRMREVNQATVTYRRGSTVKTDVPATVYERSPEEMLAFGIPLSFTVRDYLVDTDELADFGEPREGDQVTDGTLLCAALPLGQGEPVFHYTTSRRDALRIHTKVIQR